MPLPDIPEDEKLAIDLIMLLENQQIPPATVLAALEMVRRDYQHKLQATQQRTTPISDG